MQVLNAKVYLGKFNELRDLPQVATYLDPDFNPPYNPSAGGAALLLNVETLDLLCGLADQAPQGLAEPGMGYASNPIFTFPEIEASLGMVGVILTLARLNDNGVGTNFGIQAHMDWSLSEQFPLAGELLSKEVWFWGDRAYYMGDPSGAGAQPLDEEQLKAIHELLHYCFANGELQMVIHDERE